MVPNNTRGYAYALAIRRPRGHGEALVLLADSETGSGRVTFYIYFLLGELGYYHQDVLRMAIS